MQSTIFAVVVAFLVLFAAMTISVAVEHGFDVITAFALLVLALIGFGVIGALLNRPPDE
jgi:hypothetical protein